jgi:HupE / UreJ protein
MILSRWPALLAAALVICGAAPAAFAHRVNHLSTTVDFSRNGGTWSIEVSAEARRILEAKESLSLLPRLERGGSAAEELKAETFEKAREYFPERVAFYLDDVAQPAPPFEFSLVEVAETDAVDPAQGSADSQRKHIFIIGNWSGRLPADARKFYIALPGDTAGVLIIKVGGAVVGRPIPYFPGEQSKVFEIPRGDATVASEPAPDRFGTVFARFLGEGFKHIVPEGFDHILFVLGLFFLSRKFKPLLWQVTAFTIAHSITLALAMLNVVRLPEKPVEIAIALSIAFVAIENLWRKDLSIWRPFVVFGFGLVHGLGFASAFKSMLGESGTPSKHFVAMLVSFNVGVELGQLTVIALAFLAVGWFWSAEWYRQRVSIPASIVIACFGLYWAVERML